MDMPEDGQPPPGPPPKKLPQAKLPEEVSEKIEAMSEQVRKWLVDEEWFLSADAPTPPPLPPGAPAPPPHPGFHFFYNCRTRVGKNFLVLQPKTHEATLFLASMTTVGDSDLGSLSMLTESELVDFTFQTRSRLILLDADLTEYIIDGNLLRRVALQRALPYDGLTKLAFMQAVSEITKVHDLVVWQLRWAFEKHRLAGK